MGLGLGVLAGGGSVFGGSSGVDESEGESSFVGSVGDGSGGSIGD